MIDVIISKLPEKESSNDWMVNLKGIIDNKLAQMSIKLNHPKFGIIKQNCEIIVSLVKTIVSRKPQSPKKSPKKTAIQTISTIVKSVESYSVAKARELLHKACMNAGRKPKVVKKMNQLPPLYMIGGTSLGGLYSLPKVKSPYLPENKTGKDYTLVLDLDETLVHYYEINGKGKYNIRPN